MLEDAKIAGKLKRRLEVRKDQCTKQTIECKGLSAFMLEEITGVARKKSSFHNTGRLDALAASGVTEMSLQGAADLAIKASMEGYFSGMKGGNLEKATQMFKESLIREEYNADEYLCRQGDEGDKMWVLEEGKVAFIVNKQLVAGSAHHDAVFGELSLVYGVPRTADILAKTDLICWSIDRLCFRRIQALTAKESLKTSASKIMTKFGKQASFLLDEQEQNQKLECDIKFEDLHRLAVVGQGSFGSVYITKCDTRPDVSFALKRMSKASIVDHENEVRVTIEKNALQQVSDCPFIITLFGTYQDADNIYFLTECVQGGNLISYMINKDILTHSEAVFYSASISKALIHIHNKGLIHRDIKPENCLIDKNGYLKLCDFGMAKRMPHSVVLPSGGTEVVRLAFTMCGTPEFMAPEFVLSTGYDKGVDWWALGCILVEMYSGRAPFDFDGDLKKTFKAVCLIGMGRKVFDVPKPLKKKGMEDAASFCRELLTFASERIGCVSSADVLRHKYFTVLNLEELEERTLTAPYIPEVKGATDGSNFKNDDDDPLDDEESEPYLGDQGIFVGF